ncbi:unnamed protein product [Clavelina lepadiformis]|uniref:C-type lectin domain-containing protein n=1 Tax=Clavelina lepadiformis TaxID=159417 RepID=A0ABP0H4C9_CLALP
MEDGIKEFTSQSTKFIYHRNNKNFSDGNIRCKKNHNGSLAIIKDQETLDAVVRNWPTDIQSDYYLIGLERREHSVNYTWIDGTQFVGRAGLRVKNRSNKGCAAVALYLPVAGQNVIPKLYEQSCEAQIPYLCAKNLTVNSPADNSRPGGNSANPVNVTLVATVAALSFLLLICLTVVTILLARRKKLSKNKPEWPNDANSPDPGPYAVQYHNTLTYDNEAAQYAAIDEVNDGNQPNVEAAYAATNIIETLPAVPPPVTEPYAQVLKNKNQATPGTVKELSFSKHSHDYATVEGDSAYSLPAETKPDKESSGTLYSEVKQTTDLYSVPIKKVNR